MSPAVVWRIAADTRDYAATDLSGGGAADSPGRWNELGQFVLYTSENAALAYLETAAHINPAGLPMNRYLVKIVIPRAVYGAREELDEKTLAKLAPAWNAIPGGRACVTIGSVWYARAASPILVVPSAIVPECRNILVNAKHPGTTGLKAVIVRKVEYGELFRSSAASP